MLYHSDIKAGGKKVGTLGTVGTLCDFGQKMTIQECQLIAQEGQTYEGKP